MRSWARAMPLGWLLLVFAVQVVPASAANTWSDTDPLVLIRTPGGNQVPVYVETGTDGIEHLAAAQAAAIAYTVKSIGADSSTMVTLTVMVPCDVFGCRFRTRAIPSTGPLASGAIYGLAYGISGQPMIVQFKLPVP